MQMVSNVVTWPTISFTHTTAVVNIGFRESDYSVTEGASPPDQYPKIKLAKDKTIAQPLSVQVVPLTVDQFKPLGIPLPDGILFADLSDPAQCMWRFD